MTLAIILLVSIFSASSPAARYQTAPQAAPPTKPAETPATQDQGTVAPAQNPPPPSQTPPQTPSQAAPSTSTPAKSSAGQTSAGQSRPAAAKRPHHKKRVLPPNCDNTPAGAGTTASGSSSAGDPPAAATTPAPGTSSRSANCPPAKVIVRHGGTSEPSIQLAGGTAGDHTSHQLDTANQMLGATEANLKRIAGRQLNSNQQEMVNQIRQFMNQSKTAADAGDLERARTLAWKAQLLSEELVKPDK